MSYMACTMLCTHSHIIDGQLITHSHPYSEQSHQHSGSSVSAFGSLQFSLFVGTQQADSSDVNYRLCDVCFDASDVKISSFHVATQALRAPPVC